MRLDYYCKFYKNSQYLNMQISLPPGTSSSVSIGTITFQLTPVFLNSSLPAVSYCLKLWGAHDLIPLSISSSFNQKPKIAPSLALLESRALSKPNPNTSALYYSQILPVTVNLAKLTNYFIDMNVIVIVLRDARSGKEVGLGYVRIKRYIVNGLIGQFQQRVEIVSAQGVERNGKRVVIGEVGFKVSLDVPINMPTIPSQNNNTINQIISTNHDNKPQPQPPISPKTSPHSLLRKLIVQPHVFQSSQGNRKQFVIENPNKNLNNNYHGTHNAIKRTFSQQEVQGVDEQIHAEEDHADAKDILRMMGRSKSKPKSKAKVNVLEFMEGDSIKDYPDLDELVRKYGRNNVCAQRMRLKLDQAKYLNKAKLNEHFINNPSANSGYIIKLLNIPLTISSSTDYTITVHLSQKSQQILNQITVKNLTNAGLYLKTIQNNNLIQIENKLYKGKLVVKNNHIDGSQIGKVYLKRKDNNKKVGEFDVAIENVGSNNIHDVNVPSREDSSPQKFQNNVHPNPQPSTLPSNKLHYYISVKPLSPYLRQPQISLHPLCQKQPVQGKKMIFTAQNVPQTIKITILSQNLNQDKKQQTNNVSINPSIKMKQQNLKIGKEVYRVLLAVGKDVEGLMKIVISHDSSIAKNVNQQTSINPQSQPSSLPSLNAFLTRSQKLELLLASYQCLLTTSNPACLSLLHKLSNPSSLLTYEQQLSLFQQLCLASQMPYPIQTTNYAFKQLLHGEFSMYWSCFVGYRAWNSKYQHALTVTGRQIGRALEELLLAHNDGWKNRREVNRKIGKIHDRIIQRLFKSKQCLFSLIPIDTCLAQIQTTISNTTKHHHLPTQQKQQSKIQIDHAQNLANPSDINQHHQAQNQQTQHILSLYQTLLTLLCRYQNISIDGNANTNINNRSNSKHCVKIQQLSQILSTINNNTIVNNTNNNNNNANGEELWINEHQFQAIAKHKPDKDNQLLFQVVGSCCAQTNNDRKYRNQCDGLLQQLNRCQKIESLESSQSEHDRMYTENNTNKMYTEQPQRMHTEDIHEIMPKQHTEQSNPNPKTIPSSPTPPLPHPSSSPLSNTIKIYLTSLHLATNFNTIIPTNSPIHIIIQIYQTISTIVCENSEKVCIWRAQQKQLPKWVKLKEMQDYDVVVKVYNDESIQKDKQQQQKQRIQNNVQLCKYEGVFIANSKLDKIMLYNTSGNNNNNSNSRQDMGYISTSFHQIRDQDNDNDDQLIIHIKNQTQYPSNLPRQQQHKRHQQQLEQQLLQITKPSQSKLLTCPIISYKVLSISPALRSTQTLSITIQHSQHESIIYPSMHAQGKLYNKYPQQQYVNITVANNSNNNGDGQFQTALVQRIRKCQGVQQMCFIEGDRMGAIGRGKVRWMVTIQLGEYLGQDDVDEVSDDSIRRWMVINFYHMESIRKISEEHKQFTVVITTDSKIQPVFVKDFPINFQHIQPSTKTSLTIETSQQFRTVWLGLSTQLPPSSIYRISIYNKSSSTKYTQQNILCHFQFKIKYHINELGIFQNKGYLIDASSGHRLAVNLIQVCYNDVFSKQQKGREIFQNLLTVFNCQNVIKISQCNFGRSVQALQKSIRNYFGFNNTQIHLLFQLECRDGQLLDLFSNWDVADVISAPIINQSSAQNLPSSLPISSFQQKSVSIPNSNNINPNPNINLNNYSIADLCSEYQIYDFTNSGLIPISKFQMINKLIFGSHLIADVIPAACFDVRNKSEGWVRDLAEVGEQDIDYLFVLWCMRKWAKVDNYFGGGSVNSSSSQKNSIPHRQPIPVNPNPSLITPQKQIQLTLLGYRNLTVDGQPATLSFYINGDRIGQPIPRCFTHQYKSPTTITVTQYPILLQIYNKKYGTKELFNQELVGTVRVYEEKVQILGGQVFFMIQQDEDGRRGKKSTTEQQKRRNSVNNGSQNNNTNSNININNTFRQSRRQKWQNLKQSREDTQKITDILSRLTA